MMPFRNLFMARPSYIKTGKLSYRKDDHVMCPIYGCPENFPESLTTPKAFFLNCSWAFVPIDPMDLRTKFEVRDFTRSWDNIVTYVITVPERYSQTDRQLGVA